MKNLKSVNKIFIKTFQCRFIDLLRKKAKNEKKRDLSHQCVRLLFHVELKLPNYRTTFLNKNQNQTGSEMESRLDFSGFMA